VRDLPLLKTPEGTILVSQRSGIRGMSVKGGNMLAAQGDAIAAQAREILRTVKVQLQICAQSTRNVPTEVIDFAES
jgi:hypothetical protein